MAVSTLAIVIACKMHFSVKCFALAFVCVGGYKITSVPINSNDDSNYSLLITNQSYDVPSSDFDSDQVEYQRKSSTVDDNDIRSEALIKKIHPFVYPKQFNTLEGMPTRRANTTGDNFLEIRNMENGQPSSERFDDTYMPHDHKHNVDLMPLGTHLFDSSKHGNFHYGYSDKPQNYHYHPSQHAHHCLLGLLHGADLSLILLGILGFVAYVINVVLGLVDRLNVPLLGTVMAATPTAAMTNTVATKTLFSQRQNFDDRTIESHQKLLKDFERILQMAIEAYEQKMNAVWFNRNKRIVFKMFHLFMRIIH